MREVHGIHGGRVLLPDGGIIPADLSMEAGCVRSVGAHVAGADVMDARDLLVLPGLVDIHGDAFERQLAPRPEVRFSLHMALADTDRQLVANGITTAFHGITCSWEGGLRGLDMARELVNHLAVPNGFSADNRVHLRFENHNLEAVDEVLGWMESGLVDFLAFNDHLPSMMQRIHDDGKMSKYAERSGLSTVRFREILEGASRRGGEVPRAVALLAKKALEHGVPMASHDDMTRDDRDRYQNLGCDIAEFPMRAEAAMAAREFGNAVIMGAPNVVRGGSHLGGISAAQMAGEGVCTVLASDYYYPAMFAAPFRLAADGVMPFGAAWSLVSRNPARAARLEDRGDIAAGQRADLLLVDDSRPGDPRLVASLVAGVPRYASQPLSVG
jgi:alpha-D-ribose 1-methylphosphonate 5-triphosphate diphosphatase